MVLWLTRQPFQNNVLLNTTIKFCDLTYLISSYSYSTSGVNPARILGTNFAPEAMALDATAHALEKKSCFTSPMLSPRGHFY